MTSLTGRRRYRHNFRGQIILQVEVAIPIWRYVIIGHHLVWRDARLTDMPFDMPFKIEEPDEDAIDRMAQRLLDEISISEGVIHLSGPDEARSIVRGMLKSATDKNSSQTYGYAGKI